MNLGNRSDHILFTSAWRVKGFCGGEFNMAYLATA
jgi:hypothetical protein